MTEHQQSSLEAVAINLAKLNQSIKEAVASGLSIEIQRAARHHAGGGYWGDIMVPCVVKRK
jgi:hypothetical protein